MTEHPVQYASFWRRFNAYGIDATIVFAIALLLDYLLLGNAASAQSGSDFGQLQQLSDWISAAEQGQFSPAMIDTMKNALLDSATGGSVMPGPDEYLSIAVSTLYNVVFVLGPWQATPGKHWLGCKLVGEHGERLSIAQAFIRHAVSGISMLPLGLGCLTIFWTKERLAPHDWVAKTRVVIRKGESV